VQSSHTTWLRRIPLVPSVLVFDDRGALRAQFIGTMSPEQNDELKSLLAKALKAWN